MEEKNKKQMRGVISAYFKPEKLKLNFCCKKHKNEKISFFCTHPNCPNKLLCQICLIKNPHHFKMKNHEALDLKILDQEENEKKISKFEKNIFELNKRISTGYLNYKENFKDSFERCISFFKILREKIEEVIRIQENNFKKCFKFDMKEIEEKIENLAMKHNEIKLMLNKDLMRKDVLKLVKEGIEEENKRESLEEKLNILFQRKKKISKGIESLGTDLTNFEVSMKLGLKSKVTKLLKSFNGIDSNSVELLKKIVDKSFESYKKKKINPQFKAVFDRNGWLLNKNDEFLGSRSDLSFLKLRLSGAKVNRKQSEDDIFSQRSEKKDSSQNSKILLQDQKSEESKSSELQTNLSSFIFGTLYNYNKDILDKYKTSVINKKIFNGKSKQKKKRPTNLKKRQKDPTSERKKEKKPKRSFSDFF